MPFFSSRREPSPEEVPVEPVHQEEEKPKRHFFSRREASPTPSHRTNNTSVSSVSRSSHGAHEPAAAGPEAGSRNGSVRRSLLHRSFGNGNSNAEMDPSIVAARERVVAAEAAERDADRALEEARRAVREARDHVKRLEEEAREEARLAKIKQYHAREVSKRAKPLGRRLSPTSFASPEPMLDDRRRFCKTVALTLFVTGHGEI